VASHVSDVVDIASRRKPPCGHRRISVDLVARRVDCQDCCVDLGPWWWLEHTSKHDAGRWEALLMLQARIKELKERLLAAGVPP
jgi:hypothetical protein